MKKNLFFLFILSSSFNVQGSNDSIPSDPFVHHFTLMINPLLVFPGGEAGLSGEYCVNHSLALEAGIGDNFMMWHYQSPTSGMTGRLAIKYYFDTTGNDRSYFKILGFYRYEYFSNRMFYKDASNALDAEPIFNLGAEWKPDFVANDKKQVICLQFLYGKTYTFRNSPHFRLDSYYGFGFRSKQHDLEIKKEYINSGNLYTSYSPYKITGYSAFLLSVQAGFTIGYCF